MEKAKYTKECELKTRTVYQQGCYFPTMLHIQEICFESRPIGQYPVKCYTNDDFYIMDDDQRLEQELEERFDCLGEIDTHYLCHIVQTIPLYIDSQPLRERVYNFRKKVIGEYSEIDGESIYDNRDRFVQGELVFVLKEDSLTVGVVITNTIEDQTCKLWVIGDNRECYIEQVVVSRILKYRDILGHIKVETAYMLKKHLYNLGNSSVGTDEPIWLYWRFFETSSHMEEFGMQVYTVPIPNNHAGKILCKDLVLSDDGWHYRIVEDDNNAERMLWGYIDLPITFDKPINRIERIVQEDFPIGFNWKIQRLVSNGPISLKTLAFQHSKIMIDWFYHEYNKGLRYMSQNHIDILARHINLIKEQLKEDEFQLEKVEAYQSIINKGKKVLGELKVIKSFRPYGMVDDIDK